MGKNEGETRSVEHKSRFGLSLPEEVEQSLLFAASAIHDLKAPLSVIAGYADALRAGAVPKEKEEQYLETISSEAKRLSGIISELLILERLRAGGMQPRREGIDLSEAVRQVLLSYEREIERKGLSVELSDIEECVTVFVNRETLIRVITNLVDNAVKFSREGGALSITIQTDGEFGTLRIRNECEGISDEDLPHVFDRFFRTEAGNAVGSGIGLYSAKTVAEANGGRIRIESEYGVSVTVTLSLPTEPQRMQ